MELSELIKYLSVEEVIGNTKVEISGLCTDSRKTRKGDLFICYRGENVDSHEHIAGAIDGGAVAVVCEKKLKCNIAQIIVKNARRAVAALARAFYSFVDKKLKIVGVTGTNGKTTTTYMLDSIFTAAGKKTGVIGTLGIKYAEKFIMPELTTPDPIFLHSVLCDMYECGVEYVFMEVSAHALYFGKIDGIKFEAGIFTNCTQDHLDFFKTMEEYAECKKTFFKNERCLRVVVNSDDGIGLQVLSEIKNGVTYGLDNPADVFAVDIKEQIDGASFVINLFDELYEIKMNLSAIHNVYNALGAAACAKILGIGTEHIAKGLNELKKVSGRLEHVASYNGGEIFVDFAHTPDGLQKSLQSLKKLCKGKLFCLFGCGGNRDKTKRPIMGKIAGENSDFCIITSDNPRYEDPYDIINDVASGLKTTTCKYVTVTDRISATEYAINMLEQDDILLVAGKGGEYYQEVMGIKHIYNDNDIIKEIISEL